MFLSITEELSKKILNYSNFLSMVIYGLTGRPKLISDKELYRKFLMLHFISHLKNGSFLLAETNEDF